MNPNHAYWATCHEFARIMGKSEMWVSMAIRSGLLASAGIMVLDYPRLNGKGRRRWAIHVTEDLLQ